MLENHSEQLIKDEVLTDRSKLIKREDLDELGANWSAVNIESDKFDPKVYLRVMYKEKCSYHDFERGITKLRLEHTTDGIDQDKVQLILKFYDEFLAAKMVLDRVNRNFVSADKTANSLKALNEGLKYLKINTSESLKPLSEKLVNIRLRVDTMNALNQITQLLNINRDVQLALVQEDNTLKAVDIIRKSKELITNC